MTEASGPNAIVIGAQRCGTTQLHHLLNAHGAIYVPQQRKETHYFDQYYDRGTEWYGSFFPNGKERERYAAIAEVTPDYLYDAKVAERLVAFDSGLKLVLSLRDPVSRFVSHYHHWRRINGKQISLRDFYETISEATDRGLYFRQLERFLAFFPSSSFHVMIFEEWTSDVHRHLRDLGRFLGLDAGWPEGHVDRLLRERSNSSYQTRFPRLYRGLAKAAKQFRVYDVDPIVDRLKATALVRMMQKPVETVELDDALHRELRRAYRRDIGMLEDFLGRKIAVWPQADG